MSKYNINLFSIPSTVLRVLLTPRKFFRGMHRKGGIIGPLVFMIVMGIFSGLIEAAINILRFKILDGIGKVVTTVLFVPVKVGLFGFVVALVLLIIWRVMGSRQSYETSYRCVASMSVLMPVMTVISRVPYWGGLAEIAIFVFFIVIVSEEVHEIPPTRAWLVFGILGLALAMMYQHRP
ncbi:MAG: hypothetical protein HQL03_06280 [Nitrospirae bacterium]|nr:hypothetical protein [Nitrospirota bacterium]MBF0592803.1 hypothetical protein [Nitrospirota bacterium]